MHINMKHWKLISNDGKKAALRHSSGHTMTLSVKGLHPANREELSKIPLYQGGKTKQSNPKLEESESHKESLNLPSYSKGGEAAPDKVRLPGKANSLQMGPYGRELVHTSDSTTMASGGEVQHYDDGGFTEKASEPEDAGLESQNSTNVPQTGSNEDLTQSTGSNQDNSSQVAPDATPIPAAAPQAPSTDLPQPGNLAGQYQSALAGQQAGIQKEAAGQVAEAQAKAAPIGQEVSFLQDAQAHSQQFQQDMMQQMQHTSEDIQKYKIDPSRYMSSMNVPQKISTGIGLLLGGFGAGMTHTSNDALDFLNKQIDRDISAQKAELGKKENLVSIYSKMLGDDRVGTQMATLMEAKLTSDKILQAGLQSQNPIINARAQQASNALLMQHLPALQQLALQQGMINAAHATSNNPATSDAKMQEMLGYMRVVKPEMAKEMESRYIPGVGMSSVPVPDKDRSEMATKTTGLNMARDLRQWAQQHSGSLNPATVNEGKAKATAMLNYYRTATDQGVIKPSELEFDSKIVDSDPTKFFNKFRVDPKYKTLEDSMTKDLNSKRQEYGLNQVPNTSNNSNRAPSSSMEGKIKVNPQTGERIQLRNGQWVRI